MRAFGITGVLLFLCACLHAQKDSSFLLKYPYIIGNVAFSVDSLVTPAGSIPQGSDTVISVEMYHVGNKPVTLIPGKSNRFVSITYDKALLLPAGNAHASIHIRVPEDVPVGPAQFEAAFVTDDEKNPYKFLYFAAEVIPRKVRREVSIMDTVPRMVFDSYLYDFGFLRKGRILYYHFRFTNRGGQPLVLHSIMADKGIEIVSLPDDLVISPGNGGTIAVKINARRYVGVLHKSITIRSNDPENPLITLGIHGTVKVIPAKKNPTDYCIGD